MQFSGDYHVHTTYSDGRANLKEMFLAARLKGLSELGIADHGPANIGTGVKNEATYLVLKKEIQTIQHSYLEPRLLLSAEANILNLEGEVDIGKDVQKELDYLLVGLHPYVTPRSLEAVDWLLVNYLNRGVGVFKDRVKNLNTKALLECIHRYDVWAITHPGLKMPIEKEEVARACIARDTAWEINTGHQFPSYKEVYELAKMGVEFIVNSDAHFPESVGEFTYGEYVLKKAGVEKTQVRNALKN